MTQLITHYKHRGTNFSTLHRLARRQFVFFKRRKLGLHFLGVGPMNHLGILAESPFRNARDSRLASREFYENGVGRVGNDPIESDHLSPNAGLLAVAGVFRSLGLPRCVESNLGEWLSASGDFSRERPSRQQIHTNATIAECLLLAQSGGGECVEELLELSKDECLSGGLNLPIPGYYFHAGSFRGLGWEALWDISAFSSILKKFVNGIPVIIARPLGY